MTNKVVYNYFTSFSAFGGFRSQYSMPRVAVPELGSETTVF